MSYSDHVSFLRQLLSDNWTETPIDWPNVALTPPERKPWVRFTVQDADRSLASIGAPGSNLTRQPSILYLQLFTPSNEGDGDALRLAEALAAIYNTTQYAAEGLHFRQPASIKQVGVNGAWYQVNVLVPFVSETFA